MPLSLSQLTRAQIEVLPKAQTVFFFPVGPMEDHGPHLGVGVDLDEASWLCRAAAERLEKELPTWVGVLMPLAPLGVDSDTTEFAIRVRAHVLRDWLVDACRSLGRSGFTQFVCFSGHLGPRQLTAIEEAGKMLVWKGGFLLGPFQEMLLTGGLLSRKGRLTLISASSALVSAKEVKLAPLWPDPLEHGGKRDTSVALAIASGGGTPGPGSSPSVTLPARAQAEGLPESARQGPTFLSRGILRAQRKVSGYWGAPAGADLKSGEKSLQDALDVIFPKLRATWDGTDPSLLFRSWYSVLPPNRSFFRAWLMCFAILGIFLAWIWMTFRQA